jgi:hypothetical protein
LDHDAEPGAVMLGGAGRLAPSGLIQHTGQGDGLGLHHVE